MEYKENDKVCLKNGQIGTVTECIGGDYMVEIALSASDWERRLVRQDEIDGEWEL